MKTREVIVKDIIIGGNHPILVQSMCTIPLTETTQVIRQINQLAEKGARLVRFSVRNLNEAQLISHIVSQTNVALCADIHFDYKLAIESIAQGIHKVRINPGNIGGAKKVKEVVAAANERGIPIRIGVNGGSLDKSKYPHPTAKNMVESAKEEIALFEKLNFNNIVVSLKSSNVRTAVEANRLFASQFDYPLHLGVTESGFGMAGIIKSSVALGSLLLDGIGSTLRVSLTGDPLQEVEAGYHILRSLGLYNAGVNIISCPTCGRTDPSVNLEKLAQKIEESVTNQFEHILSKANRQLDIAVMGCEVNGPGEAADAQIGVAGAGRGKFLLFVSGKAIGKVTEEEVIPSLLKHITEILQK